MYFTVWSRNMEKLMHWRKGCLLFHEWDTACHFFNYKRDVICKNSFTVCFSMKHSGQCKAGCHFIMEFIHFYAPNCGAETCRKWLAWNSTQFHGLLYTLLLLIYSIFFTLLLANSRPHLKIKSYHLVVKIYIFFRYTINFDRN